MWEGCSSFSRKKRLVNVLWSDSLYRLKRKPPSPSADDFLDDAVDSEEAAAELTIVYM